MLILLIFEAAVAPVAVVLKFSIGSYGLNEKYFLLELNTHLKKEPHISGEQEKIRRSQNRPETSSKSSN